MTKPTYLVEVIRKEPVGGSCAFPKRPKAPDGAGEPPGKQASRFMEPVRASNRREAMVLAKARYPGHDIGRRVLKADTGSGPLSGAPSRSRSPRR